MDKTLYYYITAGATTGIAGLLHPVYASNGISRVGVAVYHIFYNSWDSTAVLGIADGKTMGTKMVCCWNRRYNSADDCLCDDKSAKSDY